MCLTTNSIKAKANTPLILQIYNFFRFSNIQNPNREKKRIFVLLQQVKQLHITHN